MKKSVIALAVAGTFAVAGAAQAQTTVTPYLTLDTSIGTMGSDATRDFDHFDSNIASSVVGLRASRDLGNGLTAIGQLEGDANTQTGAGSLSNRVAAIGLRGDFGQIMVGRQLSAFVGLHGTTYAMGGNSVQTNIGVANGFQESFRDKAITYTSPSFGGVTVQAQYAIAHVGEDNESKMVLGATWADGPFRLSAAVDHVSAELDPRVAGAAAANSQIEQLQALAAAADAAGEPVLAQYFNAQIANAQNAQTQALADAEVSPLRERTTFLVGGTYTIGDLVLSGNFIHQDFDHLDDEIWFASLGAAFKVMPQMTVGGTVGTDDNGTIFTNFQARYHLHPAAMLYAMVGYVDRDEDTLGAYRTVWGGSASDQYGPAAGNDDTGFAVGMLLSF